MINWRKSSYSGGGGAGGQDCVEVAKLTGAIGMRDSKAPETGHLSLPATGFTALVARVKRDELDL
ncbi:DUF397 domain-containing protein [Actinomadura macrotermitis]|uniref:DUF397 domain-containing protein n=1 Tax=Actinomadura macrotermitis TaxID=2585200 RepID=A0A7K0C1G6_9ACTN|nr:DUF397 domain-containing protein [Actinomadura macrotermitis]MQY07287.1 hypothetical protein [Actinomadura macrotermitis]